MRTIILVNSTTAMARSSAVIGNHLNRFPHDMRMSLFGRRLFDGKADRLLNGSQDREVELVHMEIRFGNSNPCQI